MIINDHGHSPPRFVIDIMLGKVAKWLRILGYDALYSKFTSVDQIDNWRNQGRLAVTRNRRWCGLDGVVCLSANHPREQIAELLKKVRAVAGEVRPFSRCIRCNERLTPVAREHVEGKVPDAVYLMGYAFSQCSRCGRIYWPGTHRERMLNRCKDFWGGEYLTTVVKGDENERNLGKTDDDDC